MPPWVEQSHTPARQRVYRMGLDALIAITQPAGQPEVRFFIAATPRRRDDVFDLQPAEYIALMAATVAAPIAGLCPDARPDVGGDTRAHGLSGSRKPRRTASARACAFWSRPS